MHALYPLLAVLLVTSAHAQIRLQQVDRKVATRLKLFRLTADAEITSIPSDLITFDPNPNVQCADQPVYSPSAQYRNHQSQEHR